MPRRIAEKNTLRSLFSIGLAATTMIAANPPQVVAEQLIGHEIAIHNQSDPHFRGNLASNGDNYLVAWFNVIEDPMQPHAGYQQIYSRIVSETGTPVGSPVNLTSKDDDHGQPAVASNGHQYLTVWTAGLTNSNIEAIFLYSHGATLGSVFTVNDQAGDHTSPDIVWSGNNYLVVWSDQNGNDIIKGQLYTQLGAPVGGNFRISGNDDKDRDTPVVAFNGRRFMVVWNENDNLVSQLLDASGNLVGDNFHITNDVHDQYGPAIDSDGTNFFVAWQDEVDRTQNSTDDHIYAKIYDDNGLPKVNRLRVADVASDQGDPSVAWGNDRFLVTWWDTRDSNLDPYAQAYTSDGKKSGAAFRLSNDIDVQVLPRTASNGSTFLTIWDNPIDLAIGGQLLIAGDFLEPPFGQQEFSFSAPMATTSGSQADQIEPIAFTDSVNLAPVVELPVFSSPVDIYLGYYSTAVNPDNRLLFTKQGLKPLPIGSAFPQALTADHRYIASTQQRFDWSLTPIPYANLPSGQYEAFVIATQPDDPSRYYRWSTSFTVLPPAPAPN